MERQLKNMARLFNNLQNVIFLELYRPLAEEVDFELQWRLPGLTNACKMIILLHGENYMELPGDITGSEAGRYEIIHLNKESPFKMAMSISASSNCWQSDNDKGNKKHRHPPPS